MLTFLRGSALAATLFLVPAASLNSAPAQAVLTPAVIKTRPQVAQAQPALTPFAKLGVQDVHDHGSGLAAAGQTAEDFENWACRSPENMRQVGAFRDYLAAEGLESVVPVWQLVRTSSSWAECGAQPFEVPPPDKWERIVKTLKFVRDDVIPRVGKVETLSAYRNEGLNACSHGAPKSAHREFFALDLAPVNMDLDRNAMIRSVCAAHAQDGRTYDTGLGFYTGRRFHVDSSGYRKWGADGRGVTSPCVTVA